MKKYKSIPISAAREIAKKYAKQQVIIVTWDAEHGREHVTTYGTTKVACAQAAQGGNKVKKALGWSEALCNAQPRAAKKLRYQALDAAVERAGEMVQGAVEAIAARCGTTHIPAHLAEKWTCTRPPHDDGPCAAVPVARAEPDLLCSYCGMEEMRCQGTCRDC